MKHFLKLLGLLTLIAGLILMGLMRFAEHWLIANLPAEIEALSSPMLRLSAAGIERGSCVFQACVHIRDLHLQLPQTQPLVLDDLALTLSPFRPHSLTFRTDSPTCQLDADIGPQYWTVRRLSGQVDSFVFQASGHIDMRTDQGTLTLTTIGLRHFLSRFFTLPFGINLLIKDSPQTVHLTPKNGKLTLFGLPLLTLR